MKTSSRAVTFIFVAALFSYFFSESILRQFVVSNMNQDISMDEILTRLPATVRDAIEYKMAIADARARIKGAKTPDQKVMAMTSLAFILEDKSEQEEIYKSILAQYPASKSATSAYTFFLLKKGLGEISIENFHKYIDKQKMEYRFSAWMSGYSKLKSTLKVSDEVMLKYLQPLLIKVPDFRDYSTFYSELENIATRKKDGSFLVEMQKRQLECMDQPYLEDYFEKLESTSGDK
jgi:hypothetical protein